MKIAIIGAHGFLGQSLINTLIDNTDHEIVAISLHASKIPIQNPKLQLVNCDVFDKQALAKHLEGCTVVYYFVHMMAQHTRDFADAESDAAKIVGEASKQAGVARIIYMGGLGNDAEQLSKHLASRHHTGEVLRDSGVQVIEFRASLIVGKGSISYDIITNLVTKLPVLTLPKWSKTSTQPIAKNDVDRYLLAALSISTDDNITCEIGGPEVMTYESLMRRYAKWKHTPAFFIHVPIIPANLAALWLNLFTPRNHAKVGKVLVDSLGNQMIVTNNSAKQYFPAITTQPIDTAFE